MTGIKLKLGRLIRRNRGSDPGQALVELAFCVPIFVLLMLGAVEFGRFAYLAIELTNAAKAAAQYGGQNPVSGPDVAGMQAVAALDAPEANAQCTNFTTTVGAATCACVSGATSSPAACVGSTCAAGSYLVQTLTITTSARCAPLFVASYHSIGQSFSFNGTLTIQGHAVQEVLK